MPYMIEQSVLYTCEVSTTIEWLCDEGGTG